MSKTIKLTLRQIKLPLPVYQFVKNYCEQFELHFKKFYFNMIEWFIQYYEQTQDIVIQASHKHGKILSMWIDNEQLESVQLIAQQANVSDARVLYTAMVLYVEYLKRKMLLR